MSRVLTHKVVKIGGKDHTCHSSEMLVNRPTMVPENIFIAPPRDGRNSVMGWTVSPPKRF